MVKFGLPSTKKDKKAKKEAASPLMANDDDEPPKSSSRSMSSESSRAQKDEQREKSRREREERRKKRDQRLEDSSKSSKSKSKKSSKPKLSQEEKDARDANLGCCQKFAQFVAKLIHLVDGLIGLIFVIYGSLIMTQFQNPAMEAVITTLTYGSVMLFTAIMGVVGFYSRKCKRIGLSISAYMGPFIAFFYLFMIIALLASPDEYFDYLTQHKDVLYLNDAEIATLRQILPFFYIVLAGLGAIEICRFLGLRKIRETLVKYDAATERITSSHLKKSKEKSSRSNKSDRSNLTDPLLGLGEDSSDEESDVEAG